MSTEAIHCPSPDACGGHCDVHDEAMDETTYLDRLRVESALASEGLAETSRERILREHGADAEAYFDSLAAAEADTESAADRVALAATIDGWTERVALAANHEHEKRGRRGFDADEVPKPIIVVNPDDLAAMRRAHSASETDGPIHLIGLRVVADEHVPARQARLRYDVNVPL